MNRQDFGEYLQDLLMEATRILDSKGHDYAGDYNVLANFNRNAEILGLEPEQVWAVYFMKHIDAIMTYVKGGKLESEGIEGRIIDAINYLILFGAMVKVRGDGKNSSPD